MRPKLMAILALGMLAPIGSGRAQDATPWWQQEEPKDTRGYIGGLLAAGIGANGQIDTSQNFDATSQFQEAYVDTSVLFALRGGLILGKGNRWLFGFEVAPMTNRLDWRQRATATGFVSVGNLVPIKKHKEWAWLWKVGLGVGGGRDYRFLVGLQLDVLTFNYKMHDSLWIDLGVPTIRLHVETANEPRYNVQFVFPLGITFGI